MSLTPRQDALTVEVVPLIAWQCSHLLTLYEVFHANNALFVGLEQVRVVLALIHGQRFLGFQHSIICMICALSSLSEESFSFFSLSLSARGTPVYPHDQPNRENNGSYKANHAPVEEIAVKKD